MLSTTLTLADGPAAAGPYLGGLLLVLLAVVALSPPVAVRPRRHVSGRFGDFLVLGPPLFSVGLLAVVVADRRFPGSI